MYESEHRQSKKKKISEKDLLADGTNIIKYNSIDYID